VSESWTRGNQLGMHINAARFPGVETRKAFLTPSSYRSPSYFHLLVSCACLREQNSSQGGQFCDTIIRRQGSPTVKPGGDELCRIGRLP